LGAQPNKFNLIHTRRLLPRRVAGHRFEDLWRKAG